jgi:hypothetical protein
LAAFTVVREEVAPVPSGVVTRATASAARPTSATGCPTPFLIKETVALRPLNA